MEKKQIHDHKAAMEVASRKPLAENVSSSSSGVTINKENNNIVDNKFNAHQQLWRLGFAAAQLVCSWPHRETNNINDNSNNTNKDKDNVSDGDEDECTD